MKTPETINIEKYAEALNNLIGVDSSYFQGDKDVDAIVELIVVAKKLENRVKELEKELEDLEAEYDRVYEQAEADIRGNMADGGTSCHWCADKTKVDAVQKIQTIFSMHYGTYTNKDTVPVREVFVFLNQIAKELLEGKNNV